MINYTDYLFLIDKPKDSFEASEERLLIQRFVDLVNKFGLYRVNQVCKDITDIDSGNRSIDDIRSAIEVVIRNREEESNTKKTQLKKEYEIKIGLLDENGNPKPKPIEEWV